MGKIQRIYETTQEINFISPQKEFSLYWNKFQESELGQIYKSLPWSKLSKALKITENRKGPSRIFSPQGMLSLMFLKSYVGCSDRKLINHLNAFNEGTRLVKSIRYGRNLFGKISCISADDIYATNANRKYCTAGHIVNNFKRKGRAGKHEEHRQIIAKELRKERTIRMEGSFGTEKEHYGLTRIKARTDLVDLLWCTYRKCSKNSKTISRLKG